MNAQSTQIKHYENELMHTGIPPSVYKIKSTALLTNENESPNVSKQCAEKPSYFSNQRDQSISKALWNPPRKVRCKVHLGGKKSLIREFLKLWIWTASRKSKSKGYYIFLIIMAGSKMKWCPPI